MSLCVPGSIRKPFGLALAAAFLALTPEARTQVVLGRAQGTIEFEQVSSAVGSHLASAPAVADTGPPAVGFFVSGQFTAAARTGYAPDNTTAGTTFRAGTYVINPPVADTGTAFLLEVQNIDFQDGASYRFGSRRPDSPSAHLCPPVLPESQQPDGTDCTIGECASLVNVRVHLTGAAQDLDALRADVPAGCLLSASVQEGPGSPTLQAQAPKLLVVPLMRGSGGDTGRFLARSAVPLIVSVGCAIELNAGETGFVLDPTTGLALFASEQNPVVTGGCGEEPVVDVEVPVRRISGNIKGLFDVSGHTESLTEVAIPTTPFSTAPPIVPAGAVPDRADAAAFWTLANVPEGEVRVEARAVIEGGDALLKLPARSGPNGAVAVVAGQTTDLDTNFVARPRAANGRLVLLDPGLVSDLPTLRNPPYASFATVTSRMTALGSEDTVIGPNGGSGFGGESQARLRGAFDATTRRADLDYGLLLGGLSPIGAATDGSGARTTPWDVRGPDLVFGQSPDHTQTLAIDLRRDLHFAVTPPPASGGELPIPEQTVCFGALRFEMRVPPADGALYAPRLDVDPAAVITTATTVPGVTYQSSGRSDGTPRDEPDRAPQALVHASLPEGARYPVRPRVRFVSASSGADTQLQLGVRTVPPTGALGCGESVGICLVIDGGSGTAVPLEIDLQPDEPVCRPPSEGPAFTASVDSGGVDVDFIQFALDGGAPIVLCAPCGANPAAQALTLGPEAQAPGEHTLVVTAGSQNGCTALSTRLFRIADVPLALQCPAPFTVLLGPGQDAVPADDPRIASGLVATAVGACDLPAAVTDDRPASFPVGATDVHFNVPDGQGCATTVTVARSRQHLAYTDAGVVKVRRLEDDQTQFSVTMDRPGRIAYDREGTRLAVLEASRVSVLDADSGTSLATIPGSFTAVAFRPTNNRHLALVESSSSPNGPFRVKVSLDGAPLIESDPIVFPAGVFATAPEIAWSPDGQRLTAALDTAATDPVEPVSGESRIFIFEWRFDDGLLGAADESGDFLRPAREIVKAVAYVTATTRLIATSSGPRTVGTNLVLNEGASRHLAHVDIFGSLPAAAFVSGDTQNVGLLLESGFVDGPSIGDKGEAVALARDAMISFIAVARRQLQDVVVFRVQFSQGQATITQDRTIAASPGSGLAFRPPN